MKIKIDFVTNSSSSSFIAWGVELDDITFSDEMKLKVFEANRKQLEEVKEKYPTTFNDYHGKEYSKILDASSDEEKIIFVDEHIGKENILDVLGKGNSIEWQNNEYVSAVGISKDIFMKNHPETKIKDIEEVVAKELNEILSTNFTESDICSYDETWYDG